MKLKDIFTINLLCLCLMCGCDNENNPVASEDLGIPAMFAPGEDADPRVKKMFEDYGLWVRMDFTDTKEVTNAILAEDVNNRYGATMIDNEYRESAIIYTQTFLGNVSKEFTKAFFPLELFFVKTYNGGWWAADYQRIGRSRFVLCWPNQMDGAIEITDPANLYYQDSVVTRCIWDNFGNMIASRFDEPLDEFARAGRAYDKGEAYDNIRKQFDKDKDEAKYDEAIRELCELGGFITAAGAASFESDFATWLRLLAMESYENIKKEYLDNSVARAAKYEILIRFFKGYNWDIQAAGNKFRQKYNEYKATLPPPVEDDDEEEE